MDTIRRLLSSKTPRAPLPWATLAALVLLTLAALCCTWAITEASWAQWTVAIAGLLLWNWLLVRGGEDRAAGAPERLSTRESLAFLLTAVALAGLSLLLIFALEDQPAYPGAETIVFALFYVPIIIWANLGLSRQEPSPARSSPPGPDR